MSDLPGGSFTASAADGERINLISGPGRVVGEVRRVGRKWATIVLRTKAAGVIEVPTSFLPNPHVGQIVELSAGVPRRLARKPMGGEQAVGPGAWPNAWPSPRPTMVLWYMDSGGHPWLAQLGTPYPVPGKPMPAAWERIERVHRTEGDLA